LIEASKRAVEAALAAGASDAEAYASESREREVRAHGGEVESLTAATGSGLGMRAWIGTRVGFAYGTDLGDSGLEALAARAVEAARAADEDEFAAPPAPASTPQPVLELGDPSIDSWSMAEVADLALTVEREALAADSRVSGVEQAVYAGSAERVAIASSTGIAGEYESSSCYAYAMVLAKGEDGGAETGLGFDLARGPQALDPVAVGREGAERATAMIGAGKPDSRSCPVVLDPTVAASFVGLVGGVLGADAVQRGRSPFAERLGTGVGGEALTVHDDGLDPAGPATAPFDGEGIASRRSTLIEAGSLSTFLFDTYTARRGGVESTASAGRGGYRSLPRVSASNLVVAAGSLTFEELLVEAAEGIFVTDVAGLHSGVNPVTGVFSVGASGRSIRGGELAGPVREFTIASDLVSMLGAVRAAGAQARWVPFGGSVSTPPLLIGEMTVAGA
jgi:PmbA protein